MLRNYFSPQLQERDDWRMAGSTDADSFWAERLAEVEAVGVAVSCQVCCHTYHVRAGFRRDGCRKPAIAPILPCSAPLQEDLRFLSPGARREVYEKYLVQRGYFSPQQVHGSALFYLPADFLCPPHQAELLELSASGGESVEPSAWPAWAVRLQFEMLMRVDQA